MLDLNTKFGRFAKKHMKAEYFIWLTTVDATGTPQPRPVWFIWDKDSFLIFSQAGAHKLKHIQRNPNVSVHFNTADALGEKKLIIFTGVASVDEHCPPNHKIPAYVRKYKSGILRLGATPEQFAGAYSVALRVHPTKVRGEE